MKKHIVGLAILFSAVLVKAQTTQTTESSHQTFTIVQQMPSFPNLSKYLSDSTRYPEAERKKGISGTVYVNFVVETDGALTNVHVIKGVVKGPGLDAEAVRVIATMPKWQPGMQAGKLVRVTYNLPIKFALK